MKIRFAVLTMSDKGSRGEREDKSGKIIIERMSQIPHAELAQYDLIPDDFDQIRQKLIHYTDQMKVDLVLTTGGTGFSPKDVTPEATRTVIQKEVPGIAEVMRMETFKITKAAMLSRGIAGIRGSTLIINFPGSSRGVSESLDVILSEIPHAVWAMTGAEHKSEKEKGGTTLQEAHGKNE